MLRPRCALPRAAAVVALATALSVLVAGAGPLVPGTGAALAADPVQVAEREVTDMRAEVERTARTLTEGTRRLEAGRTALAAVRRDLAAAAEVVDEAQGRADAARDRLRALAAAAYRSPVPDAFALALAGDPDRFVGAVLAQADLARVRGSSGDLLREATAERVRAAGAVRTVEQLTADAAARERDLAAQVAELQAVATRSAARLQAADARLSAVRDTARRSAERAARARSAAVLATCDGGTLRGAANGFLNRSALCPLDGAPGHALRADAAAAFNRMSAASLAERGERLCVTDSYRSYAGQVSVFRRKPQLAAVPGTSRHGLGVAVDIGCGGERFGSATYRWLKANAGRFGWVHPAWAEPGGAMPEPWHWEYVR